jgi:hypothetical protein
MEGDLHCAIKKHHNASHEKEPACFGVLTTLSLGCA